MTDSAAKGGDRMNGTSPVSEYELQVRLYKRASLRRIKTDIVFAIMLLFVSYLASYAVMFLCTLLIMSVPIGDTSVVYSILDALIYTAQLTIPIVLYLIFTSKSPAKLFSIRNEEDIADKPDKTTFKGILAYFAIAFSMSQIMASISTVFSDLVSYFASFISENLILDPAAFSDPVPMSVGEFTVSVISVAVLPALLEELLFRGVFLGMFLRYGKTFAIVMSSVLFASAHGSIDQMMYSFVYGIIFGYIAVKTESLTAGIIIHFMNNFYSCVADYFGYLYDTNLFRCIIIGINIFLIAAGITVVIYKTAKNRIGYREKKDFEKEPHELTNAETFSVFTSPVMLFYYAFVIFETLYTYISYNLTL